MTTLVLQLTPTMATRVAKAADVLQMATHEDVGLAAVGAFPHQHPRSGARATTEGAHAPGEDDET